MSNNSFTEDETHVYRQKLSTFVLNLLTYIFMGIFAAIPPAFIVWILTQFFRHGSETQAFAIILICTFAPIFIFDVILLLEFVFLLISSFFSKIQTTSEGMEQKIPPFRQIRIKWSDIDRIGKLFLFTDVLYLKSYEVIGASLSLKIPFRIFAPKQGYIALTGFKGWPKGQLADDIKKYVPQLFVPQPNPASSHLKNDVTSDQNAIEISKENRLLAVLSHISVLISITGVIFPLIIFLIQRKKSQYLEFQALQAFIWQIVSFVYSAISSVCLAAVFFYPILFPTIDQNGTIIGPSYATRLIAMMVALLLMVGGKLIFIVYGVIGAILTYQGKNFRYLIIGKLIDKNKTIRPA
jgi:uncharacterized Tic20 family protein